MTFEDYWSTNQLRNSQPPILAAAYKEIAENAWKAGYREGYDGAIKDTRTNMIITTAEEHQKALARIKEMMDQCLIPEHGCTPDEEREFNELVEAVVLYEKINFLTK